MNLISTKFDPLFCKLDYFVVEITFIPIFYNNLAYQRSVSMNCNMCLQDWPWGVYFYWLICENISF